MNSKKRKPLSMHPLQSRMTGRVEYVPPDAMVIEEFTQKVCDALVKEGRSEFEAKNIRWNIANFLKLIAELTTKQLNRGQEANTQV